MKRVVTGAAVRLACALPVVWLGWRYLVGIAAGAMVAAAAKWHSESRPSASR